MQGGLPPSALPTGPKTDGDAAEQAKTPGQVSFAFHTRLGLNSLTLQIPFKPTKGIVT